LTNIGSNVESTAGGSCLGWLHCIRSASASRPTHSHDELGWSSNPTPMCEAALGTYASSTLRHLLPRGQVCPELLRRDSRVIPTNERDKNKRKSPLQTRRAPCSSRQSRPRSSDGYWCHPKVVIAAGCCRGAAAAMTIAWSTDAHDGATTASVPGLAHRNLLAAAMDQQGDAPSEDEGLLTGKGPRLHSSG
jgi:hypothetical protein